MILACKVLWDKLYGAPIVRATVGLKSFKALWRFIRFDDKTTRAERRRHDKLAPTRDLWEEVNNFRKYYLSGENITVDEQLVPFRGRCPFQQYMPSKPDKYGMKIWWVCDSETYYLMQFQKFVTTEANKACEDIKENKNLNIQYLKLSKCI